MRPPRKTSSRSSKIRAAENRTGAVRVSRSSKHEAYEIPDELDLSKLRTIGFGLDALRLHERKIAAKPKAGRTAHLAADVSAAFLTDAEVNNALRMLLKISENKGQPKKSA